MTNLSPFHYLDDHNMRQMFETAYQAITITELWNYMEKDVDNYMFNSDAEVRIIYDKIEKLGYNGHSGASFGYIMRHMQFIATNGIEKHKQMLLQNSV
jgi:hypothetical protein